MVAPPMPGTLLLKDCVAFRTQCRHANKVINNSHRTYYQQRLQSRENPRDLWHTLHSMNLSNTVTDNLSDSSLCHTFSDFVVAKIQSVKNAVSAKLNSLTPLPAETRGLWSTFDIIPHVTADEVLPSSESFLLNPHIWRSSKHLC
jgi:hypothetical protein